jgi:hypothetical protein
MIGRLSAFALLCALLCGLPAQRGVAVESREAADEAGAIWTAIIPDAFPGYIYTWHMNGDGIYREDGRDSRTSRPIQPTLSGRWSREGPHMVLRQDSLPFVFDGVVLGNLYSGTLYFDGRSRSRFCAIRGEKVPERCDTAPSVAMHDGIGAP